MCTHRQRHTHKLVAFVNGISACSIFFQINIESKITNENFVHCFATRNSFIFIASAELSEMGTEVINASFDVLQEKLDQAKSNLRGLNDNIRRISGREPPDQLRLVERDE